MYLHTPRTLYSSKDQAERIAKDLQAQEEDGWVYDAVIVPESKKGYYEIRIYDEEGEYVASWGG